MRRRRSSRGSFGFARLGAKNRLAPITSTRIYSYRISAIQVFLQIPIDIQTDRYSVGFWEGLEARDRGVGFRICAAVQGPANPLPNRFQDTHVFDSKTHTIWTVSLPAQPKTCVSWNGVGRRTCVSWIEGGSGPFEPPETRNRYRSQPLRYVRRAWRAASGQCFADNVLASHSIVLSIVLPVR